MKFIFKARNAEGKLIEGIKDGNSPQEVVEALYNEGLDTISIDEHNEKSVKTAAKQKEKKKKSIVKRGRVNAADIAVFCRQMATMITAGVSIMEALEDIVQL